MHSKFLARGTASVQAAADYLIGPRAAGRGRVDGSAHPKGLTDPKVIQPLVDFCGARRTGAIIDEHDPLRF